MKPASSNLPDRNMIHPCRFRVTNELDKEYTHATSSEGLLVRVGLPGRWYALQRFSGQERIFFSKGRGLFRNNTNTIVSVITLLN